MLPWLGEHLIEVYGPFRLLTSYLFLAGIGTALAAGLTWFLLPKLWRYLPTDGGRIHAVGAQESKGKPVSAGLIFISIFVGVCLLVLPYRWQFLGVLACVLLSMLEGYMDDRTPGGWGEYRLGLADLGISLLGALIICRGQAVVMWLPLFKTPLTVSPWVFIPLATVLLWFTINATNCTDGVDGLSGSLSTLAFTYLGGILYGILGHQEISAYLLVPHYPDGAIWGIMAFVMVGALGGYLWYNANPSMVLMGDAGSRPMGLLLGILVLACGNPFLILVVASVVLVNGGTGLVKVALLRFFKIGIFKTVRYPLHDHFRQTKGWSNTQVLVRFMLLQAIGTPLLLVLLFKVR
ncbi:MAG TPA: phospho-N-acetylmuramoyl-pentapeptide-transferase [Anaerolineae bacterium]|nr:phospho-N-acetylmuramoyl-pentapeptide-transferase [Anaerolineae bacterium]HQH37513.1 phospho-N-acetylmuramoyl-pentapeptide-transferase [Anaerolineae bacterium]